MDQPGLVANPARGNIMGIPGKEASTVRCLNYLDDVYRPVNLDGQDGIVINVPPEVYKLVRLVIHLARCLYAEYGGGLRHLLRAVNT